MNDILIKIGGDISGLSQSLSRAGSQLKGFTQDAQNGFNAIGKVGKVVTAAGVGLSVGLGAAVKTAANFDREMSRVGALSGATDKEFKQLTDTAKHLGETTVYSATEAADGMAFLAMAF